jgi:uncharacterized protein
MIESDNNSELIDNPNFLGGNPSGEVQPPQKEWTPFSVLAICMGLFIGGNMVGSALMLGLAAAEGLDFNTVIKNLSENSPIGTRNFMRMVMLINHLFSFIIPSLLTGWIIYKNNILGYFKLTKAPSLRIVILGLVFLLVSIPLVQYAYQVNKMLPLPEWMMDMESSTGNILEAIISKENFYEVIINVILIAVIPGIGEELMFRGLIQQQFGRLLQNEHLTVWLAAAFFSAIHMQFQGFLARMILGALLGYLLVWSRNLWVPMIVHFLNNGLQVIMIYVMNIKPSEMDKIEQGEKIHWTMGVASLMLVLMVGKYISENHSGAPKIVKKDENTEGW